MELGLPVHPRDALARRIQIVPTPHLFVSALGGRHVHDLELHPVRPQEIDRIPSVGTAIWKLRRTIENFRAQLLHQLIDLVDLLMRFGVEGEMMESDLVNLERMRGELRFRFPHINGVAVSEIYIDGQMLPVGILKYCADVVAEEFQKRPEELHRFAQITDGNRDVINRSE